MSKRKGVTIEEKRNRLMNIYYETKQVYNLKEIEKLGSRAGIVLQTIKDVNQSLVDDGMVQTEKVGAGNFYWAFPSKAQYQLQHKVEGIQDELTRVRNKAAVAQREIDELLLDRVDTEERQGQLDALAQERTENARLVAQLKAHAANDPEILRQLESNLSVLKEGADRWTDNIWNLKTWLVNKHNMECAKVDQWLGLSDEFDYVE